MKHMAITLLALLCASRADLDAAEPGDMRWTRQSVEAELRTFKSVLKKLGLKAPMKRARDLAARIKALGGTPTKPGGAETVAGRAAGAATGQASTIEMLRLELAEEQQAIKDYAAEIAEIMEDEETLDMLEEHLVDEIQHSRWMKAQIAVLSR